MSNQSTDDWQRQPQRPMHHFQPPPIGYGASNSHRGPTNSHHHHQQQQQQNQNFLLSVLLLQQELHEKQRARQQQHPSFGKWEPQGSFPDPRAHQPSLSPQSQLIQSKTNTNINSNNNSNSNSNNDHHFPPAQSIEPQKLKIEKQKQQQSQQQSQQQQQQNLETRTWTEGVASLIRNAETSRKKQLSLIQVCAFRIERKSIEEPWGLGFVSMNHHSGYEYKYSKKKSNNKNNHNPVLEILLGRRIIVVKSPNSMILPGDMMLEIDGKPVSSWQSCQNGKPVDNTTANIASYLRGIRSVSIVVLRHNTVSRVVSAKHLSQPQPQQQQHGPYKIASSADAVWNRLLVKVPKVKAKSLVAPKVKAKPKPKALVVYRNPWFWETDANGRRVNIPYADNQGSLEHELFLQQDGSRAPLFLPAIPSTKTNFCEWLAERKGAWRKNYNVYKFANDAKKTKTESKPTTPKKKEKMDEDSEICNNTDFWSHQGFSSFDDWLRSRTVQWHRSYSWNRLKRQRIEEECFEKVVGLPLTCQQSPSCSGQEFHEWLTARRVQWKMSRRKRKRQRLSIEGEQQQTDAVDSPHSDSPQCVSSFEEASQSAAKRKLQFGSEEDQQMAYIDEILEEKEKERQEALRKKRERPPIDILKFLDAKQGIPDDVVAHCFCYLDVAEHAKLLCISLPFSKALEDRHGVWQRLCPSHWILPRRPRKPWHEIYLTRLRKERALHQKRWDDLLIKCSAALFKRDDLQKIEKLIVKAETEFGFDLNYSSGVVCERNSILNLAVIHGRYKVVRWLVDTKHADIETADRGNFTPLLNAAWSGDRWLVRFFLQRRSNRDVVGTQHYTQGIAPPGFEGKTAEGWAEHRGHPEIAKLIKLGL